MPRRRVEESASAPKDPVEAGTVPPMERTAAYGGVPSSWKPASRALDRVLAIPTVFPSFDVASRVGGLPVRRIHTIHGATHGGKSAVVGGFLKAFVTAGHVGGYIDAEHATDLGWFEELFEVAHLRPQIENPLDQFPNFVGDRPANYEATIKKTDEFFRWLRDVRAHARAAGRLVPCGILVVDSINKLTPKREIDQLQKMGGDAIDKAWGRLRAAYNQAWLDHLTPMLAEVDCALVLIAQERKEDEDEWDPNKVAQIKGGGALTFDASMLMRVTKASAVYLNGKPKEGERREDNPIVGFKHRIRIYKSKVGHMDGRYSDAFFNQSNGLFVPAGFDQARDALEVGTSLGIVKLSGSWYSWGGKRWQGEKKAVLGLQDRALRGRLLAEIAERGRPT